MHDGKVIRHGIYTDKRKSGIALIGDLSWGSHFCHFYESKTDFLEIFLPYLRAGLANNEYCVWEVSHPIDFEDAEKILRRRLRDFDKYSHRGQIEIIPSGEWLAGNGRFEAVIAAMLDRSVRNGLDGLRFACHAFPPGKGKDKSRQPEVDFIGSYNAIGLFAYPRKEFDATRLMEVVNRHQYALIRNAGKWEVVESSEARIVKADLSRSEQKLRFLFHNMSEGFAYHRLILNETGQPCDYVFLEVNEAFEKLTGLSAKYIIGKRATEVLPGIESDPTDWIGRYGMVALNGTPAQFESYSESLGRWYAVSAFSPYRGFFAVTFSDITERKEGEEAIRKHGAFVQGINRILNAALVSKTEEELGVECLEVAEKLTQSGIGFIAEINDRGLRDIAISNPGWAACRMLDPSGHRRPPGNFKIHGIYGRAILNGKSFFTNDTLREPDRIGLPEGHPPVESFLGVPLIHEGQTIGMIALGNRPGGYTLAEQNALEALAPAIVEAFMRKRAEERLRKAHDELDQRVRERTEELRETNRTLRMISECNQILVHATDEVELMNEICRIIIEMGGYRMAWVGYAEEDEEKTVRSIASMGFEQGYLENARITWADCPRGQGPTGACIRSGQVCFGRSFLKDPDLAPWKEEALKRGYQSSIALPLISGGKTFGALTIYSEEPHAFDGSEIFLRELAEDLAYGIVNLRTWAERDQARQAAEKRAAQLQALTVELVQAEQKERKRLARILHDHLQQILVGAKFGASLIRAKAMNRDKELEQTAEELIGTLDEAIRASRSLSADLNPPILHEKGLAAGLKWLGRQMKDKHGLAVEVAADDLEKPESEQVRQVLFDAVRELLLNAVKYAQVDTVKVGMRILENGELEITAADSGIGFDPAKLETPAATIGGLGLFGIRERLSYLGGRMEIDAAPGKGSRFVLIVPARPEAASANTKKNQLKMSATASSEKTDLARAGKEIRVLLADDHPVMRNGLMRLLEDQPDIHVVGEVGDGRAAVNLALELKPDVVLMDISLPLLSGLEATRQITSQCPETRVIGLSMHEAADMVTEMLKAGAAAYVTKGGPIEHLISVIRSKG